MRYIQQRVMSSSPPSVWLRSWQKFSYGTGHMFNDLCASMWFSYTLFYFHVIMGMAANVAGVLVMLGQVVDSLATPLCGWAIDQRCGCMSRRWWHFIGTAVAALGFAMIFCVRPTIELVHLVEHPLIYYGGMIALFQCGWALTQIAHLSLIPPLAARYPFMSSSELTAIRYTATVCCNISFYVIAWLVLKQIDPTGAHDHSHLGPADFYRFRMIALVVLAIGVVTSALFYGSVSNCCCSGGGTASEATNHAAYEPIPDSEVREPANGTVNEPHFLRSTVTYKVALMYMSARLFVTLNLIYMPLYLNRRWGGDEMGGGQMVRRVIATVPLMMFLSSFGMSVVLKYRNLERVSHKAVYLGGSILGLVCSSWITLGLSDRYANVDLYTVAALIGASGAATMISSLCLAADFVELNAMASGASVYGCITFIDKMVAGAVVLLVQNLYQQWCGGTAAFHAEVGAAVVADDQCPHFYEHVLSYVCGGAAATGLALLATLHYCR